MTVQFDDENMRGENGGMKNIRNVIAAKGGRVKNDGALRTQLFLYLLVAPTVILILSFLVYPVTRVFYLSFQNYNLTQAWRDGFAGFKNYQELSHDGKFYSFLTITAKWVLTQVVGQLMLGAVVALLLNQEFKGRDFARAISLVPWAVSDVLATMLWALVYDQSSGLINDMLMKSGIISEKVAWLTDSRTFFPAVNIAELQRGVFFFAISILAALRSIPADVYKFSAINGCGPMKSFFYITLPYPEKSIVFTMLPRGIWEFSSIDMIFTTTNGGPIDKTTTLPIYMVKTAIIKGGYGYGSTIGVIAFLVLLVFAVFYVKVSGFKGGENE